ncbi:MAG: glycosyltransferase [Chloroflexi bacterium]|nr:glycosyltransferase [Chloroflexota bacterium]
MVDQDKESLQIEIATLATELNRLNNLRLIRLFHLYRRLRRRIAGTFERRHSPGTHSTTLHDDRATDGRYDVIFMSCADWRWRFQRPQHLSRQWAAHGHRVFFVSPDFRPAVNPAYSRQPGQYAARPVLPGVQEIHLAGSRELRPLQERMTAAECSGLAGSIEALARDFNISEAVCILELPFWWPLARQLRAERGWKVIYDLIDRWYGILPQAHAMLSEEAPLVRNADAVVATARLLQSQVAAEARTVQLIPNGAEIEHFSQAAAGRTAIPLDDKSSVIGYFGNLAPWLDVELLAQTAREHPEWAFVLIGSGTADLSLLRGLPNVRLTGEVPYADLPDYLHSFAVSIIPFRLLPVTASTDPVKFYEYLASGSPVVATALPELAPYRDYVYLAADQPSFARLIAQALADDNSQRRAERRAFAAQHSWQRRYEAFDALIRRLDDPIAADNPAEPIAPTPIVDELQPWSIRAGDESTVQVRVRGRHLTSSCVLLADEARLPTRWIADNELQAELPVDARRAPGVIMLSAMDERTWRQSNRRAFIVLSV